MNQWIKLYYVLKFRCVGPGLRAYRGKQEYSKNNVAVDSHLTTFQAGADCPAGDHWVLGGAFSYASGASAVTHHQVRGSGENRGAGVAVHATWLGESGSRLSLIARYGRQRHELAAFSSTGIANAIEADNDVHGFEMEYARRFALPNAFFIEPQAGLALAALGAASSLTGDGVEVGQERLDSLLARAGVSVGRTLAGYANIHARAAVAHEFDGRANARVGARKEKLDFGGTGVELGVGASVKLGQRAHFYAEVEKSFAAKVTTAWQWNAGVWYDF